MSQLVLFIDDGGVMSDNHLRGMQWQRMVSEFFPPILGGLPEAWAEANRTVITRMLEPEAWAGRIRAASDFESFDRFYQLDWLGEMCRLVGVPVPQEKECLELARRAEASIIRRVRASFPGVIEAIRTLHQRGYALHTASAESSSMLEGYLEGMGVRECFGCLYGPDLINTFKEDPQYYARIFADAGIAPADAVVIDDNSLALDRAAWVGAKTVLVSAKPPAESRVRLHVRSLADLTGEIEKLY